MSWSLDKVSVWYETPDGVVRALDEVSLSVRAGERVAITGGNGSGKSTLGLCLAGLISPSCGHVRSSSPAAVVFQSPDDNLIAATPGDEIALTLEHRFGSDVTESAVKQCLARFGLSHLGTRPMERLSGGERQVIALACALTAGRDLLVLDEPTAHLDPPARRSILEALIHMPSDSSRGVARVLITQYENEVRQCERVIHLGAGRVLYDGHPEGWSGLESEYGHGDVPDDMPLRPGREILQTVGLSQVDSPGWPLPESALADVHVSIRQGEAIAICGPIGSGKTTFAYHLAGLIPRFAGRIERFPFSGRRDSLPVVMIQFPERQLFCPTVDEDIAFGLRRRGYSGADIQSTTLRVMSHFGLPMATFAQRSPFSLSGGQKRRAALACLSALPADLYILDEPNASLDGEGYASLSGQCRRWLNDEKSFILISHDLAFLRALTRRVWVLDRGRILFDGSWAELDRSPQVLESIGFR